MENAATIYYKSNTRLNIISSLLFIKLLLKLTDLLKQDSSKRSLHRAIILVKYVQFILFFHILVIFLFLSKLKKVKLGFLFFVLYHYKLHTKKPYCCVFNRISNHVLLQENCSSSEKESAKLHVLRALVPTHLTHHWYASYPSLIPTCAPLVSPISALRTFFCLVLLFQL